MVASPIEVAEGEEVLDERLPDLSAVERELPVLIPCFVPVEVGLIENLPQVVEGPGSRGNPYTLGETVRVGDWDVTVLSATPDATDAVLTENEFNEPPAAGHQFYMVELAVTYQGDTSEAPIVGLTITSVGDSAVAYDAFEAYCGVLPNELDTFSEVFPGGTQTGNLCWSVTAEDADSLVLIVDNAFSFDQDRAYLGLS